MLGPFIELDQLHKKMVRKKAKKKKKTKKTSWDSSSKLAKSKQGRKVR
jgi:hypothetical protein